jgi:hypothetical protein
MKGYIFYLPDQWDRLRCSIARDVALLGWWLLTSLTLQKGKNRTGSYQNKLKEVVVGRSR